MEITGIIEEKRYIHPRKGYRRRIFTGNLMLVVTGLMTAIGIIPLVWIIVYVAIRGAQNINLNFFTQLPRPLGMTGGGVLNSIEGTLILSILAALFSIPIGLLTALYTANNPNTLLGTTVRFGTDVLSGVPSIVVGIFCYGLVVKTQGHYSALAGGISLAIIMLPTIIRTTEEMIKLVPNTLREGSLALGAAEWKTAILVTLPAALNGILTGFLLALARASGETAPLLFTALGNDRFEAGRIIQGSITNGASPFETISAILSQPVDSLPLTLFKYSQQPFPERVNQSWSVALVLLFFVLLVNIIARVWIQLRSKKMNG